MPRVAEHGTSWESALKILTEGFVGAVKHEQVSLRTQKIEKLAYVAMGDYPSKAWGYCAPPIRLAPNLPMMRFVLAVRIPAGEAHYKGDQQTGWLPDQMLPLHILCRATEDAPLLSEAELELAEALPVNVAAESAAVAADPTQDARGEASAVPLDAQENPQAGKENPQEPTAAAAATEADSTAAAVAVAQAPASPSTLSSASSSSDSEKPSQRPASAGAAPAADAPPPAAAHRSSGEAAGADAPKRDIPDNSKVGLSESDHFPEGSDHGAESDSPKPATRAKSKGKKRRHRSLRS